MIIEIFTNFKKKTMSIYELKQFIMEVLDPIGVVLGLLISIPVFLSWYYLWQERRYKRRMYKQILKKPGKRPCVLIIDVLPKADIYNQVLHYCQSNPALKDIPKERYFKLNHSSIFTPEQMAQFQRSLDAKFQRITQSGADAIHLFFAGPLAAAMVVGAEFANVLTYIYQYDRNKGTYIPFGPLNIL